MLRLAFVLAFLPAVATAQSSQMLMLIDMELPKYGISYDVSKLTNAQAAQLYTLLRNPNTRRIGNFARTRQSIIGILGGRENL